MTEQTNAELAQLRAELHATNKTMERIATAVEKTLGDHEGRMRVLEQSVTKAEGAVLAMKWVLGFVGLPTVAAVLLLAAKQFH